MKRVDLIRHLERHRCYLEREGANHSIYRNPANGRCAAVPRYREIKETTARTICDQLGIARPWRTKSPLCVPFVLRPSGAILLRPLIRDFEEML